MRQQAEKNYIRGCLEWALREENGRANDQIEAQFKQQIDNIRNNKVYKVFCIKWIYNIE